MNMDSPAERHRLEGLEPDNLLAFLALLGLLRALETARPAWRPKAAWDLDDPPLRPALVLAEPQMQAAIAEAAAKGVDRLARHHSFRTRPEDGSEPQERRDLSHTALDAKADLETALDGAFAGRREEADLLAALLSNAALKEGAKEGQIDPTPLCLLFGQGHQHFLERLDKVPKQEAPPDRGRGRKAVTVSAAGCMAEALFAPWERIDPTPGFRWDTAEDVRYALIAEDPSGSPTTVQHGANRLAAVGLPVLAGAPVTRGDRVRLQVLGGAFGERGAFSLAWPVWREPIGLAALRALLAHPKLREPGALRHLGVDHVRETRRINVGKFMNFTLAEVRAAG
jgi:hypothetical protein